MIQPLNDQIAVLGYPDRKRSDGGIWFVDDPRFEEELPRRGKVLAVGPGKRIGKTERRKPIGVKPGDLVWFTALVGYQVDRPEGIVVFLKEREIDLVLRKGKVETEGRSHDAG